jgi:hypothetical protein
MAGRPVSTVGDWFAEESAGAPALLRERSAGYLIGREQGDPAEALAAAAHDALRASLAHSGREAALDLLAADALVTLALKARAFQDPGGLRDFAARLRAASTDQR